MISGALRTGSRASVAVLLQNLYDKWRGLNDLFSAATCSPTLIVYCNIISGNAHKQLSCTKPHPQSLYTQIPKIMFILIPCGICVSKNFTNCFCTKTFYFHWPNFLSMGMVNTTLQSTGTGKYVTTTGHLNFHFPPYMVSYKLLPRWNQRHLDFFSIEHKSTLQCFSEAFRMSYFWKKSCQAAIMRLI